MIHFRDPYTKLWRVLEIKKKKVLNTNSFLFSRFKRTRTFVPHSIFSPPTLKFEELKDIYLR